MVRLFLALALVAVAFAAGWWFRPVGITSDAQPASSAANGKGEPLYWVAPMDPNYRRDQPGKSPMGMDLVPVYEEDQQAGDDGGVTISPRIIASLGVRTGEATLGPLDLPIETVGRVTYDEDQLVHFHSRVSGWIENLAVSATGDPVKKGQPLLELYSPDLVNAQQEFLLARRMNDRRMKQAARNNLLALGVTSQQIDQLEADGQATQRVRIDAPATGYVANLNVREGMYIKPDTEVMAIGSLESVWIIGEVFERHAGLVEPGQAVEISLPAFPGERWTGEVDFIYPELDPQTRTLRVRIQVPNPERRLRPNMFVDIRLSAPLGESLLSIPREALIRDGRHPRVILADGEGRFSPVPVTPGREVGDRVVIKDGLEAGQTVVTSAQFLIDSETNLDAALARLEDSATPETKPEVVETTGTVREVIAGPDLVTVVHDPIPEWQWPRMTMTFETADDIDLSALAPDQRIRFRLRETPEGSYQLDSVQPLDQPNPEQ